MHPYGSDEDSILNLSSSNYCIHTYGDWTVTTKATCTESGEQEAICTKCGKTVTNTTTATGHTYGEWTTTTEATCTTAGTKTRTCTACGETETAETAALGHTYSPVWSWISADDGGYTAKVWLACSYCNDNTATAFTDAEVTSETASDGSVTYTAKVEIDSTEYTATKTIAATKYSLTVTSGTIKDTNETSGSYAYGTKVTLTANDPDDGYIFDGWYWGDKLISKKSTTGVYVKSDMELTAKYVSTSATRSSEPAFVLTVSDRTNLSNNKQKVSMTVRWELSDDCTLASAGIVRSYSESDSSKLTLDNADSSTIKKNSTTLTCTTGTCTFNLTVSATTKLNNLYVVGYLTYKDASGSVVTKYTDVTTSSADS